jgi:hypothetical protein
MREESSSFRSAQTLPQKDETRFGHVPILVAPFLTAAVALHSRSKLGDAIPPFWVPAHLTPDGHLCPDPDHLPFVPRVLLDPPISERSERWPTSIASVDARCSGNDCGSAGGMAKPALARGGDVSVDRRSTSRRVAARWLAAGKAVGHAVGQQVRFREAHLAALRDVDADQNVPGCTDGHPVKVRWSGDNRIGYGS